MIRFLDRHFEEVISGICVLIMSTMVFAQVVMRYVFHAPMSWSDEIAVYCLVWSVYLAASWTVRERQHIRVLNLINVFPKPISLWLVYLSDLVWFLTSIFITYQGILLHLSLWERSFYSPVLAIDQKWPYLVVAVGFGLMTLRLIQVYYEWFKYGTSLVHEPTDEEYHA